MKPQLVTPQLSILAEGPLWDHRNQCIWWVDILGEKIQSYYPDTDQYKSYTVGQKPGTLVLKGSSELVVAMEQGIFSFDPTGDGSFTFITDPESHLPGNRFNDGKCDPQGRLWAGSMHTAETEVTGTLFKIEADGQYSPHAFNLGCSNGMAWTADSRTMYYIDSPTREVVTYDFDPEAGTLSNKRTAVTIPDGWGYPDGMTIDTEGMIWVALWDGWKVVRFSPVTGEALLEIPVPVAQVTSCAFGGPDFQDLYITTANKYLSAEELAKQPLAGGLFVVKEVGFEGRPEQSFGT